MEFILYPNQTCLGLKWLRGSDNDSIGEDVPDRRPINQTKGRPNRTPDLPATAPFDGTGRINSVRNNRLSIGAGEAVPSSALVPFIRCTREDVAIRLKQPANRTRHVTADIWFLPADDVPSHESGILLSAASDVCEYWSQWLWLGIFTERGIKQRFLVDLCFPPSSLC